jgi:hypothetical protein
MAKMLNRTMKNFWRKAKMALALALLGNPSAPDIRGSVIQCMLFVQMTVAMSVLWFSFFIFIAAISAIVGLLQAAIGLF